MSRIIHGCKWVVSCLCNLITGRHPLLEKSPIKIVANPVEKQALISNSCSDRTVRVVF